MYKIYRINNGEPLDTLEEFALESVAMERAINRLSNYFNGRKMSIDCVFYDNMRVIRLIDARGKFLVRFAIIKDVNN